MNLSENKRFALLIDADNAQAAAIDAILIEAARYGDVTSRRCYGDWTDNRLVKWKDVLNKHAIQPIQQFAYTVGKNATDSALIIDAMDLLYTGKFEGFFLVSSDSDFTRLATRLRESGLEVIGIGRRNTPEAFRSACNKFISTETIMDDEKNAEAVIQDQIKSKTNASKSVENNSIQISKDDKLKKIIKEAIDLASDDDGWANLGGVGSCINRIDSSFDPRNYNYSKLGKLILSLSFIESEERKTSDSGGSNIFIKIKDSNA